jgi:hypothetical protein
LYWYETSTFRVNGTSQQKHVKISLITYPKTPEQVPAAETQLLPFATAINDYWQPIKTWTQISLAISQNGLALSTATTTLIVATIVYWQILNSQKNRSLRILYGKLSEEDQQLLDAVRIAQETGNPTTTNIATQLQQLTKTSTPPQQLQQKLEETANTGLITKTITNNNDEPTTTWKTQLPTPKLNPNDHIRRG